MKPSSVVDRIRAADDWLVDRVFEPVLQFLWDWGGVSKTDVVVALWLCNGALVFIREHSYFMLGFTGLLALSTKLVGATSRRQYWPLRVAFAVVFTALMPSTTFEKGWVSVPIWASLIALLYFSACGGKPRGRRRSKRLEDVIAKLRWTPELAPQGAR